jgi:anti-sigma factor RsiW
VAVQASGRQSSDRSRRSPYPVDRLLPPEARLAAQFIYENGKGDHLTLYLRVDIGGESAFCDREDDGILAFDWSDEGSGYAMAAKADCELLLRVADIIYRQTAPDGARAKPPTAPGKAS